MCTLILALPPFTRKKDEMRKKERIKVNNTATRRNVIQCIWNRRIHRE
jgi:hypothetical protein